MTSYQSLFIDRTASILYKTTEVRTPLISGWIGGNPPLYFDNCLELKDDNYTFYLALQHPFHQEQMISIFIPDYETYLNYDIYPECAIKVFEHPFTEQSNLSLLRTPFMQEQQYIVKTKICDTNQAIKEPSLIKFGGTPDLIQNKAFYYEALHNDGYKFLFQINENGYPDNLIKGNYPFSFGSLYIYAKIMLEEFSNPLAGFWKYT